LCIISLSPIASSIRVRAFAPPVRQRFYSAVSSTLGFFGSTDSGSFASFAIYISSPRFHPVRS
ncbi:hypothetical protein GALMADRAFT_58669, partial [Galerina marginata CBS 339.88]